MVRGSAQVGGVAGVVRPRLPRRAAVAVTSTGTYGKMGAVNSVDHPTASDRSDALSADPDEVRQQSVAPVLAQSVAQARAAVADLGEGEAGEYVTTVREDDASASHYFVADIPGYRGWQWVVVMAAAPGAVEATVSEIALLPGVDALVAPQWTPWDERVRPGDLGPGDLLPPPSDDPRLVPGYVANGDPEIDEVAWEVGLGRRQVMSREGREQAAQRWHDGEHGPGSGMAKSAPGTCDSCGFYLPLAGSLHHEFGVCGNEMAADGMVVHAHYGCGAHSDTSLPKGAGSPAYTPYDDGALESVTVSQEVQPDGPAGPSPDSAGPSAAEESVDSNGRSATSGD